MRAEHVLRKAEGWLKNVDFCGIRVVRALLPVACGRVLGTNPYRTPRGAGKERVARGGTRSRGGTVVMARRTLSDRVTTSISNLTPLTHLPTVPSCVQCDERPQSPTQGIDHRHPGLNYIYLMEMSDVSLCIDLTTIASNLNKSPRRRRRRRRVFPLLCPA
jgi:hypothetical protein